MKSTGIVRKFDANGRFVLPMELRKMLDLVGEDDALEIYAEGDSIILKKYEPYCVFCKSGEQLISYRDRLVCRECAEKIKALIG